MLDTKRINVTPYDIKLGHPCNSVRCPVARALARAFHVKLNRVSVGNESCTVYLDAKYESAVHYWLPENARAFIRYFDNYDDNGYLDEPPQPITFQLESPYSVVQDTRLVTHN